jgi:anti-sigma regulatory factor (Ser/Thr protein kinase)
MWRRDATANRVPALDDRGGPTRPRGEIRRVDIAVASGPGAPARARGAVTGWLFGRVSTKLLDDARLLVSELVTNSVRHARLAPGAPIRISIGISDGFVHLEVEDSGDAPIAALVPDRQHGSGFGLYLVDTLAARWGSTHDGATRVWAELALAPAT